MNLKIKKLRHDAVIPEKVNNTDSGFDLTIIREVKDLGEVKLYGTGLVFEIPEGYYIELFPRSSIGKTDFVMANSVGIIDQNYRGEILIPLRKINKNTDWIQLPYRIAQAIPKIKIDCTIEEVPEISLETDRSDKGFGSSGK